MNDLNAKRVFRSFALPVPTFDYLKKFQRGYQEAHRGLITNNQALTILLAQHKHLIEGRVKQ